MRDSNRGSGRKTRADDKNRARNGGGLQMPNIGRRAFVAGSAAALLTRSGPVSAAEYPDRPITLIIPFPPGGSTTIVIRSVSDKLGEALNQQIVIDNRAGAGGTVGTRALAKSDPDGYTIGLGYTGTLAIGPNLYSNVGYDPRKDFSSIGRIAASAEHAGGASVFPRQDRSGIHRLRQSESRTRSATARPASARSAMSAASISPAPPASSSSTFRTRAPARR